MLHRRGRYSTVDRNHPEAAGVCDRGGEVQKLRDLMPEMRWSGGRLMPTGFLSCARHMDIPNPQFGGQRTIPRDPVPVRNPRPPDGATSATGIINRELDDTAGAPMLDNAGSKIWAGA